MATNNKSLHVADFTQRNENMLGAHMSLNAKMTISREYAGDG